MIAALVPARNCARWISESLESLARQTRPPEEILLYDDGSSDETVALAEALGIPQLRIIRGQESKGISNALNRMLEATDARYIARMDADDICEPDRLEIQMRAMETDKLAVVGSWARRFGKANTLHRFAEHDHDLKAGLLFSAPFCHPTVVIDRGSLREPAELRYDSEFDGAEDHELWIRLRDQGRFGNVQRTLLHWRLHDDNAGSHPEKLARQLEVQSRLRERILAGMGIVLGPHQRSALGKRCSAKVLDRSEHQHFLEALEIVTQRAETSSPPERASLLRVLASHWDLSCQFAVLTQPGIPTVWRRGRERLGLPIPFRAYGKLVVKSMVHRSRQLGDRSSSDKA